MKSIADTIINECPKCHAKFRDRDIRVLDWPSLAHIECIVCKSKLLLNIVAKDDGFLCTGVITDLGHEEFSKFKELEALSEDDIIAIQKELTLDKIVNFR